MVASRFIIIIIIKYMKNIYFFIEIIHLFKKTVVAAESRFINYSRIKINLFNNRSVCKQGIIWRENKPSLYSCGNRRSLQPQYTAGVSCHFILHVKATLSVGISINEFFLKYTLFQFVIELIVY